MRKMFGRYFLVVVVLVLGSWLRTWGLNQLPSGFQNDEASFFYNAIAISRTGMDEDGCKWPIYLHSFIDPKPALFAYLQIPFIFVFGETVLAARLPSAILAIWSLWLVWRLAERLGMNKRMRLIWVGVMAISPWHVLISRSTQEVVFAWALGLLALHVWLWFWQWVQKPTGVVIGWWRMGISLFVSMVAMYSYHSLKIVLPLLVLWMLGWQRSRKTDWKWLVAVAAGLMIIVTGLLLTNEAGTKRYSDINIFTHGDFRPVLLEQISTATAETHPILIRILHNKVVNGLVAVGQNYFDHMTAGFLVFSEGEPRRYRIPFQGLMYFVEVPLLVVGIVVALRRVSRTNALPIIFFGWWLIAPLPAALTIQEVPSIVRAFWMVAPLTWLVAVGIDWLWRWGKKVLWRKSAVIGLLILGYGWGLVYGIHQWVVFQPNYHPWNRNYADGQLAKQLKDGLSDRFNKVVITRYTGQPYIYLALEGLIDRQTLQQTYPLRQAEAYTFGKYIFKPGECPLDKELGTLFVVWDKCIFGDEYKMIGRIPEKDGNNGYALVEWVGIRE